MESTGILVLTSRPADNVHLALPICNAPVRFLEFQFTKEIFYIFSRNILSSLKKSLYRNAFPRLFI